ncbi:MAG: hypothetical protein ACK4RS_00040 [Thiothrix sp.]
MAKRAKKTAKKKGQGQQSELERELANQLDLLQRQHLSWPPHCREFRFHSKRRWRFDFAWPEKKLAVEVQGGIFSYGAHTRGAGFRNDREKINAAILDGWRVLEFTDREITNGEAICVIEMALKASIPKN